MGGLNSKMLFVKDPYYDSVKALIYYLTTANYCLEALYSISVSEDSDTCKLVTVKSSASAL